MTHRVNPAESYDWPADGVYYIRVRQPSPLRHVYSDVMRTFTKVSLKNTSAQRARNQAKEARRTKELSLIQASSSGSIRGFDGCSAAKQEELHKWHEDARAKINAAAACTESSSCAAEVDRWFGSALSSARYSEKVTEQFTTMQRVMDNTVYACDTSSTRRNCGSSTFAYVYPSDSSQKVYMCPFTFEYPDYGEKVQTVVHELSHFNHIGNTNDNTYGVASCEALARADSEAAVQTADNVGYFAKFQPGVFCNAPEEYNPSCTDLYSNCAMLSCSRYSSDCCATCGAGAPQSRAECSNTTVVSSASLQAQLSRFPGYNGSASVTGAVTVRQNSSSSLVLSYDLSGFSASGGGGMHVHNGSSCTEPGGHLLNAGDDWESTQWRTSSSGPAPYAAKGTVGVNSSLTIAQLAGRAIVVHDPAGARMACGILGNSALGALKPGLLSLLVLLAFACVHSA